MRFLAGVIAVVACLSAEAALNVSVLDWGNPDAREAAQCLAVPVTAPEDMNSLGCNDLLVMMSEGGAPAELVGPLLAFLHARHGNLLVVGDTPFRKLLYRAHTGTWLPRKDFLASIEPTHPLVNWDAFNPRGVPHSTDPPRDYLKYRSVPGGVACEVDMAYRIGWVSFGISVVNPPAENHNLLRLSVQGLGLASEIRVEVSERDGSRWACYVPAPNVETEVGLLDTDFEYYRGGEARGGDGDQPDFSKVDTVKLGFTESSRSIVPDTEGRYGYIVRGLATAALGQSFRDVEAPVLEGLSPWYKVHRASPLRLEGRDFLADAAFPAPRQLVSPLARPHYTSPKRDYTWNPLLKGYDREGRWMSTAAATTYHNSGASWSILGFRPSDAELRAFVEGLTKRLSEPPDLPDNPGLLLHKEARGECVSVKDGQFVLGGERFFVHAINYYPLYWMGQEPQPWARHHHFLNPESYIPEIVEQDLATLERLGFNVVSIHLKKSEALPNFLDFLTRCGNHNIKVNVHPSDSDPTLPSADDDLTKRRFLKTFAAASIENDPRLLAYDLAWEPKLYLYGDRRHRLDPLFEAWVAEQYGSIAHAEAVMGCKFNRRADGGIAGPMDAQLREDGPHRAMVAVYRRFVDDLVSRRYREVIRLVREFDNSHLFGARTGYGGTGSHWAVPYMQFQLTSGAAHLDFISPEGYQVSPGQRARLGLIAEYARWAGDGKPVFWSEFGIGGGFDSPAYQGRLAMAYGEMVERTKSAGWAFWFYPGGFRVSEQADKGIVGPDYRLRPSGLALTQWGRKLRAAQLRRRAAQSLTVNRDMHPSGLAALLDRHNETYAKAYHDGQSMRVRTRGTGTTSATAPLTSVGGVPYHYPCPPEFLNAEIVITGVSEEAVEIEVINTGEAMLLQEDCVVAVDVEKGKAFSVPLEADLERYGRQRIRFAWPEGTATAVLHAERFGRFGERTAIPRAD